MWKCIIALVILLIFGFVVILRDVYRLSQEHKFVVSYLEKFRSFCHDPENQIDAHQWLLAHSTKMQNLSGGFGVFSLYQPAYSDLVYRNFQIFANLIPEIRNIYIRAKNDFASSIYVRELREVSLSVDDALLRLLGSKEEQHKKAFKDFKNPFMWLREGVRWVITLPITFFYWTGIIQYTWYSKLANNAFFKILSAIVAIIGFVSSIVTVVTGYDPFIAILHNTIK